MSEKHLALLASTVSLVLAAMSATALIMVNSVRSEMSAQQDAAQSQAREIQQLKGVVTQLKENQIAMLPLLNPTSRAVAAPVVAPAAGTKEIPQGELSAVPQGAAPKGESSGSTSIQQAELPASASATTTAVPEPVQPRPSVMAVTKPASSGPSAPTPPGVKVFPAADTQFVAPAPASETGAPQASLARPEDTILAALQTPTMGMKTHPVLDQVKEPAYDEAAAKTTIETTSKALENVDGILVQRIIANWKRPESARNGMAVEIVIKMARDGTVRSADVVTSSGDKGFDSSAKAAILEVKAVPEMSQVSDATYKHLYKERRVRFSPEDLSG